MSAVPLPEAVGAMFVPVGDERRLFTRFRDIPLARVCLFSPFGSPFSATAHCTLGRPMVSKYNGKKHRIAERLRPPQSHAQLVSASECNPADFTVGHARGYESFVKFVEAIFERVDNS